MGGIDVDVVVELVVQAHGVGEIAVRRAAIFSAIGNVEIGRDELQPAQAQEGVELRIGRDNRRHTGVHTGAHQIKAGEHIGSDHVGGIGLAVVRVVAAQRQGQVLDDVPIHATENRDGAVLVVIVFEPALAAAAELASRRARQQRAQRRFQAGIGTTRKRAGIVAEIPTKGQLAAGIDILVEIEGANQEVDRAVELRRDTEFGRVGVDGVAAAVFTDQIGAGEIAVGIGGKPHAAIGTDEGEIELAGVIVRLRREAEIVD